MLYSDWVILVFLIFPGLISSQTPNLEENVCARSSCYPETGDLLVGRENDLIASSTCGLNGKAEDFCIISRLQGPRDCARCDSRKGVPAGYSHLPSYMLISFGGPQTWWQSENGKERVFLQLNFEAQFHVTHIVMKFKSFRPAAMLIERSYDYAKKWEVTRYYARDCKISFPDIPTSVNSSETYCTQGYSSIEPSSGGEVVYKALNTGITGREARTDKVQNLLRMTNIRINFTKLNTLGDDIIDNNPEIRKKYFYAVEWLSIRGSCSCYGHAKRCLPDAGKENVEFMVHSVCECTHNTAGLNCERCKDGYQDIPWRPAFPNNPNECKKCECNNHSDKCRFDYAVWMASGETSGGVCLDCQHNTNGPKCDKCKPLHYLDPTKTIRDPDVCIACDCDPIGSVSFGECESGLRAGQCICKTNVAGSRCDACKTGFYNLQRDNPDGCQACGCNLFGTVGNNCNAASGQCQCKRYVVGLFCDRCKAGFWGLQTVRGCQPCDCDVGGSYDNLCNAFTGQCRCRPGIEGRKCDRVIPGYYFALSDNLRYEAEKARGIGVTSVKLIERPTGTEVNWTDVGSLRISDGNGVEFQITNVPSTGNYKLLLRFYPQTESQWDGMKVGVSRADGRVSTNSECVNSLPSDGNTFITTQRYESVKVIEQLICLEKGVDYFVRVDFNRYQGLVDHVYLDSLVLIPTMESVSIFQGENGRTRLDDFKRLDCEQPHIGVNHIPPTIDPECRKLQFSGSAVIYDGALSCNCNKMGTIKNSSGIYQCNVAGGQCPCKPNVIGRRCDKCAPGSHSFGTSGCKLCNCDLRGSLDNLCNVESGQCKCNGLGIGIQCNECPKGEWGFPNCRPCECNGHSLTCHTETGVCENCEHNTAGDYCELCKAGFFGDAKKGTPTDCQRCQCPGGSSENQFSPTCKVDNSTSPPTFSCDQCPPDYEGKQCEECSDGYYGNPLIPGGKCQKCNCNNNVDLSQKGYCDKGTGECLRCVNNTAGFFCGVCERGYYGNARNQTCKPCNCYSLGSNESSGSCDPSTGLCPCKANVLGRSCDRCAPGHWDLGSGDGCKSCDCCTGGATSAQCNTLTGICECRRDFGGPRCCGCEDGFWGKAPAQCKPCDCNPSGSLRSQCDRETGQCPCRPGVSGRKCNKCQPDTTKTFPECDNCHPCYHSWKIIIDELEKLVGKIDISANRRNVSVDYEKDLNRLDEIRRRIREILGNRTTYPKHVEEIQKRIEESEKRVVQLIERGKDIGESVDASEAKTKEAKKEIIKLRKFLQRLNVLIDDYRRNLTSSIDEIPEASIDESRKYLNISTTAEDISNKVRKTLEESEKIRTEIENKLPDYKNKKSRISKKLENYLLEFENLDELVVKINRLVCGSPNARCGGCDSDGCGQCGDSDDCDGATTLAEKALATAKKAENALREKERKANATLDEVIEAEFLVDESKKEAEIALDLAKSIHVKALNTSDSVSGLIEEIYRFLNQSGADPDEVRRIAQFVLGKKLNISEEAIKILGKRIKDAVKKLTGIDAILEETSRDLASLENLKKQAIEANSSATEAAEIAKRVRTKLTKAESLQVKSDTAVKKAKRKIEQVEVILLEIEIDLNKTLNKSVESVRLTKKMRTRLGPLEKKFEENEKILVVAETEVKKTVEIANNSRTNANDLLKKFLEVNTSYNDRLDEQARFKERVEKLRFDVEGVQTSLATKILDIQRYLLKRVEMEDLIDKLKRLELKARNTFCEVALDSAYLLECVPGSPKPKRQDDLCKQLGTEE